MSRRIGFGAAVLSGVVAFLVLFSANLRSPLAIPLRTDQQILTQGFYAAETNPEHIYSWTGPHAELMVPALDRRTDWRVTLEIKLWRPPDVPRPRLRVDVDGVTAMDRVFRGNAALSVIAPRRPGTSGLTVSIDAAPPFVPGRDTRELGVAVASIALEPLGGTPRAPRRAAANGAAAIGILAAAVAVMGVPALGVAAFAILVACGAGPLMARGIGPYVQYSSHVLVLAAGLGAGVVAAAWIVKRLRRERLSTAALGAVAISLAACFLKLLMLLHPNMPIGDGVFHAHRFEYVLAGRLYFTSLTPDNYAFPYPIFLYLVSAPFAWLTSDTLDRLALLRVVTTVADASAAALLYWMIVRATSDRRAGVVAVVWYHVMPMTAWIMTWGALTNAFAQTLFVATLALVVALPVDRTRRGTVIAATAIASAALLTHPSTCAILVGVLAAASLLYAWHGGPLRAAATGVAIATAAASVIAVAVYYAWFPSVYLSELGRAASVSASGTPSLGARLTNAVRFADIYFGWPAMTVAAAGAWHLMRSPFPRLTILLLAWAGICLLFLVVGIVTPIELRYHFAAFPALAIAAAFACSWAWRSGIAPRVAISALLAAGVWDGIAQWLWAFSTYARMVQ